MDLSKGSKHLQRDFRVVDLAISCWCGRKDGLSRCGHCRIAKFCCRSHQEEKWPQHKIVCSDLMVHSSDFERKGVKVYIDLMKKHIINEYYHEVLCIAKHVLNRDKEISSLHRALIYNFVGECWLAKERIALQRAQEKAQKTGKDVDKTDLNEGSILDAVELAHQSLDILQTPSEKPQDIIQGIRSAKWNLCCGNKYMGCEEDAVVYGKEALKILLEQESNMDPFSFYQLEKQYLYHLYTMFLYKPRDQEFIQYLKNSQQRSKERKDSEWELTVNKILGLLSVSHQVQQQYGHKDIDNYHKWSKGKKKEFEKDMTKITEELQKQEDEKERERVRKQLDREKFLEELNDEKEGQATKETNKPDQTTKAPKEGSNFFGPRKRNAKEKEKIQGEETQVENPPENSTRAKRRKAAEWLLYKQCAVITLMALSFLFLALASAMLFWN